jgi:SAM-dependent methyltransferase
MRQAGYWYPWRSTLGSGSGEERYLELVLQHVGPEVDVLDVACGHGELSVEIAAQCHTLVGYDRQPAWIERARELAVERHMDNVSFICADSSAEENGGSPHIPAPAQSFDLLLCRRGPHHWVEDARRVARPGSRLIMLVPNATPRTTWSAQLPEPLGWDDDDDPLWARDRIAARMAPSGLVLEAYWVCVVPEYFPSPEELYRWRAWGYAADEVPSFEQVEPLLASIFDQHAGPLGLEVKHSRFLWTARA